MLPKTTTALAARGTIMTKTARVLALAISACAMCAVSSPGFAAIFAAFDDSYTTPENTALIISAPGILANDTGLSLFDLAGPSVMTSPGNGTLSFLFDGSFTYTPDPNFSGTDTFSYDDFGFIFSPFDETISNIATVSIVVTPTATPLPAALPLFASGLGVMGLFGWRRKRKAADALAA
jgi:hypothetical protein